MPQDLYSTKKTIGVEHFLEGKQEKSTRKLPTGKWCFPRFPFPDFLAKIGQSSAQIDQKVNSKVFKINFSKQEISHFSCFLPGYQEMCHSKKDYAVGIGIKLWSKCIFEHCLSFLLFS